MTNVEHNKVRPGANWFLCGDSTMADYPEDRSPMAGWGQALGALLPPGSRVDNRAVNGRSSKSFIDEGRLDAIEPLLGPGDYLIISFGHNDEKDDPPRHTDAWDSYQRYLMRYVDVARRNGAEPILVTPIARRRFDESGRPVPTHGEYPDAMRALAAREHVRLVDLEAATMALLEREGPDGSTLIYCHVSAGHPNYPEGTRDDSHLCLDGARRIAGLFLGLLNGDEVVTSREMGKPSQTPDDLLKREDENVGYA